MISGVESCFAMCMPGEPLVAPGPRVTNAMPGRPVSLPCGLRHHHGAALLAAHRHGDVAVVEGIERRQIAFARHAEHVAHAVDQELVDQHLAARAHIVLAAHRLPSPARAPSALGQTSIAGEAGERRTKRTPRREEKPDGANTRPPSEVNSRSASGSKSARQARRSRDADCCPRCRRRRAAAGTHRRRSTASAAMPRPAFASPASPISLAPKNWLTSIPSTSAILVSRPAPTRLTPFSYFCTC